MQVNQDPLSSTEHIPPDQSGKQLLCRFIMILIIVKAPPHQKLSKVLQEMWYIFSKIWKTW